MGKFNFKIIHVNHIIIKILKYTKKIMTQKNVNVKQLKKNVYKRKLRVQIFYR